MIDLQNVVGFDWGAGNEVKNEKHGVSATEIEQLFFNRPIVLVDDVAHSSKTEFLITPLDQPTEADCSRSPSLSGTREA